MITRDEVEDLLATQSQAYGLLMWLADEAAKDPEVLSPAVATALKSDDSALRWLNEQIDLIPASHRPIGDRETFAILLTSFFTTSFHVRHLEFEGRLLESRVTLGGVSNRKSELGLEQCRFLAFQHLMSAEKLALTSQDIRMVLRRPGLRTPSLLWTYAWELDRRARQKGKGTVVHGIWRALPKETRKALTADLIWSARDQLLDAARERLRGT